MFSASLLLGSMFFELQYKGVFSRIKDAFKKK